VIPFPFLFLYKSIHLNIFCWALEIPTLTNLYFSQFP